MPGKRVDIARIAFGEENPREMTLSILPYLLLYLGKRPSHCAVSFNDHVDPPPSTQTNTLQGGE